MCILRSPMARHARPNAPKAHPWGRSAAPSWESHALLGMQEPILLLLMWGRGSLAPSACPKGRTGALYEPLGLVWACL